MSLLSSLETSSSPKKQKSLQNWKEVACASSTIYLACSVLHFHLSVPAGSNSPFGFQFKIVSSKYHFVVILWGKTYKTKCCVWKGLDAALSNGIFGSGATGPVGTYQPAYSSTCLGQRHLARLFILSIHTNNSLDCKSRKGEACGDNARCIGLLRPVTGQFSPLTPDSSWVWRSIEASNSGHI